MAPASTWLFYNTLVNAWTVYLVRPNGEVFSSNFNPGSLAFEQFSLNANNIYLLWDLEAVSQTNWPMISAVVEGANSYFLYSLPDATDIQIYQSWANGWAKLTSNWNFPANGYHPSTCSMQLVVINGVFYLFVLDQNQLTWWTRDGTGQDLAWTGYSWTGSGYTTNQCMMRAVVTLPWKSGTNKQIVVVFQTADNQLRAVVWDPTTSYTSAVATPLNVQINPAYPSANTVSTIITSFEVVAVGTGAYVLCNYQVVYSPTLTWQYTMSWSYHPDQGIPWEAHYFQDPQIRFANNIQAESFHLGAQYDPTAPGAGGVPVAYSVPYTASNGNYYSTPEVFFGIPTEHFANIGTVHAANL
eukprot:Phypoly_transcript_11067.p1 GENE.Phypoly_transcript_11067~~Phypoly_transcript_11067.p1  ORF type:complete len:401 (+),score=44.21 Phypoly_transcript_11067:138-1205(+)